MYLANIHLAKNIANECHLGDRLLLVKNRNEKGADAKN